MYEAVQFVERRGEAAPREAILGEFDQEVEAVDAAREARATFLSMGSDDYAWWIVRKKGATLANFISDSTSGKEFVLDLTTGELVEVPS